MRPLIAQRFRRAARDERGVSAVEFALIAPLMIMIYFGLVALSDGVAADRKVSLTAAALANLTAQVAAISSSDMQNILNASTSIIAPYDAANLKLAIACISIDKNKETTVMWSESRNPSGQTVNPTVPTDLLVPNSQLVYAQASYTYAPVVGDAITGTLHLSDHMYMSPRSTAPSYPDSDHPCVPAS
jgi:Flp pilus assembly protein TadG